MLNGIRKVLPKDRIGWLFLVGSIILIVSGVVLFAIVARLDGGGTAVMAGVVLAVISLGVGVWMLPSAFKKYDGGPYQPSCGDQ